MRLNRLLPGVTLLTALFFVFLSAFSLSDAVLAQDQDMEAEFFRVVAAMEKDYRDYEREAFEQYRSEVEALWNDFFSSTQKDWVEYTPDKTGRSRVDFETGEVTVEVLVPKKEAKRDPQAVRKKLEKELERLVVNRGKTRDYPLPVKSPPAPVSPVDDLTLEAASEEDFQVDISPGETPPKEITAREKMQAAEKDMEVEFAPKEPARRDTAPPPKKMKKIPPLPLLAIPVLENQLKDSKGKVVTPKTKESFAKDVVETRPVEQKVIPTKKGEMVKATVTFPLVPDHLRIRAERHLKSVRRHAGRFNVDVPLAFAVIHTESYFNPKAKSHVPAYGLMQLVPRSGGRDAYRYVYGKDKILGQDYLYVPDNNIELGCAYLGLLQNRYFKNVKDPKSALYCSIASYNTGMGNLSRAVTGNKRLKPAVEQINTMNPDELYDRLLRNLPYSETQKYLKKVRKRMDLYEEWR